MIKFPGREKLLGQIFAQLLGQKFGGQKITWAKITWAKLVSSPKD